MQLKIYLWPVIYRFSISRKIKYVLSLILALTSFLNHAQECPPPGDIFLNTQTEVDDFIDEFPNCTLIDGDLFIVTIPSGDVINDISRLTAIKEIKGDLVIDSFVENLDNFDDLERVEGNLQIVSNSRLENVNGFNKLTYFENMIIGVNVSLTEVKGFQNLRSTGGEVQISGNPLLKTITAFPVLETIGDQLFIFRNLELESMTSFNNLISIGEKLVIEENVKLLTINGFNNLETVGGDLRIGSSFLTSIEGFSKLREITGGVLISSFYPGSQSPNLTSIPDFNALQTIGDGLYMTQSGLTDIGGFNNVTSFTGSFIALENSNLQAISGFTSLSEISSSVEITINGALETVNGFSNITKIGGLLQLDANGLTSLQGLENLTSVAETLDISATGLQISNNSSLTDCEAICNLLTNGTIGGRIDISNNPSECSSETEVRQDCIPDFDEDGILDADDLDDDNDGILDTIEQNGDVTRDTDGDGMPDHQDLDSDNDGCLDVIEAGFTDGDANGTLGSIPDTIDPNGLITGEPDGYTVPLDSNSNGIKDFQEDLLLKSGTDGTISVCINAAPIDLFDSLGGAPDTGGVWSPSLASTTGVFDPSQDIAGVYTYTVSNGVCGNVSSQVTVTVNPLPDAGLDGMLSICESAVPEDLFDSLGGTPDMGGVWSPSLVSGTGVFDPLQDAGGTYTYTVDNGGCSSVSAQVTVTKDAAPNSGVDGSVAVCINATPINLFDSLGGVPDAGGVWSPSLISGTGLFDPSQDIAGVYTYTVSNGVCGSESSQVTVTVNSVPDAGTNGMLTICENELPVDLFNSLGGSPDVGGVWSPSLTSGTGFFDPSQDTAGVYTYTVSNNGCTDVSAQITVSVDEVPNPGVDGDLSVCVNNGAIDLFDSLRGSPDMGGVWSPSLVSGSGIFDPSQDPPGIYTYTVSNGSCISTNAQVIVSVFNNYEIQNVTVEINGFSINNSITITVDSPGIFEYSLDGIHYQSSNMFSNLSGGDYTLNIREVGGCGRLEREVSILDYPKFFTPNNDGVNDVWKLKGATNLDYSIFIFNRFGKLIKVLKDKNESWDGTINGTRLASNDYWFRIQFTNGKIVRGNFSLIRR